MTKEELEKEADNFCDKVNKRLLSTNYGVSPHSNSVSLLDVQDAYIAGAEPREKHIKELELKIKKLTQHLEPQSMTALFEQVEEEVRQEQRIKELDYAKTIIQDLLSNSDEYARQRAMDFLKEE